MVFVKEKSIMNHTLIKQELRLVLSSKKNMLFPIFRRDKEEARVFDLVGGQTKVAVELKE
jgi:hypothetical protein